MMKNADIEEKLVSKFFLEEGYAKRKRPPQHWQTVPVPSSIKPSSILDHLRVVKPCVFEDEEDLKKSLDSFKLDRLESENIETVRKESVFSSEVTENEKDIIAKRVALQQRQFAEYERRERARKSQKILAMFDYVGDEEIDEMLEDCGNDEDEVIVRLTQTGYLIGIRKQIATKHIPEVERAAPSMTDEQKAAYEQLLKKRSVTLKKTTNDQAKKQYRMGGRLGLDEALKQFQEHQIDPEKAFEGWSQARIRAYQMIEQNPNSYYYRFNAPGEVQRKGQWTEEEKKLFYARLAEAGANGQWGIFSMKIPGRVGYQCSNFYRLLVETKQINDPNYVLDERGKAHYLFDKKNSNGEVEKTFRTHSKHHGNGNGSSSDTPPRPKPVRARVTAPSTSASASPTPQTSKSSKKRKRRGGRNRWGGMSDYEEDSDDLIGYDDDNSGSYSTKLWTTRRTRTRAAALVAEYGMSGNASEEGGSSNFEDTIEDDDDVAGWGIEKKQPDNPLPGFIDPITLDEVVKPAISKYGHVMGYTSWVRCLTSWEGKRNICPLTKKPLTKRDVVILDFDNIEEYRHKIVNM
ncbi:hypothetical protein K450DRAFT_253670 [Umbelopsis ramanniana AG]|uniref:Myb-like domain-containing protein n=1 Tax=Umbelopsis ramanniana AG TaxID=1314678 RepID=A0AAD5E4N1_UMBRA|nr:uncharacterized protein K450DRAFT_253670 [Umbelopsis ramanniana AG]KAI8577103.1 hypothetical protein K450DRAFT_253670 [Umbelopsis ramanniana AG]